jgi:hypothetical protein
MSGIDVDAAVAEKLREFQQRQKDLEKEMRQMEMEENTTRKQFEQEERTRTGDMLGSFRSMPSYEHLGGLTFESREPSIASVRLISIETRLDPNLVAGISRLSACK